MKKLILGTLVLGPIGAYFYHGFHKESPIKEGKIPAQSFLYIQHIGGYNKINNTFNIVGNDMNNYGKSLSNARYGAIYYDNPFKIAETNASRAVVGVFLDPSQRAAAQEFIKARSGYDLKDIPEISTISIRTSIVSPITFIWMNKMIYPKLYNYLRSRNLGKREDKAPIVEFYSMQGNKPVEMETHIPYGPNVSQLMLTKAPEPPKK